VPPSSSSAASATAVFECRIGHSFDVPELLAAKEERLEDHLWAASTVLQELVELLLDLAEHGTRHDESADSVQTFRVRATRARGNALALRRLIEDVCPVDLAPAKPDSAVGGGA
jgi:hypothetical protein